MKKKIIMFAALALIALSMHAQSFQQALFLDGYRLGYRYNPALQNESGFLSVGQFANQTRNNFGAASFLYPRDGEVVTALHSSVTADEFLGSLQDDNRFTSNIDYSLFSFGWKKDKAYHTIEANIRAAYGASIPKEIFAIAKLGTGDGAYDVSGMNVWGNVMAELAYGFSYKFSDIISVGARAKLLVGIESLNYNVTKFDMTCSEDAYQADIEANLDFTSRWKKVRTNDDGYMNFLDLSSKDRWKLPSGAGLAVDLGVTVTPLEGLTLSASMLDLGGMLWYYGNCGKSQGTTTFTGIQSLTMEELQEGKIMDKFSDVKDSFLNSLKLKALDDKTVLEGIPFNINLGAKYEMPFYRALAIGSTANYISGRSMTYREVRGVLAWNPCACFGITGNYGTGTHGQVWSCALSAAVCKFHMTAAYSNGFGGTIPYSSTPLQPNNKMLTVGLTYDL
ncbi:MAG: hypothetical protein J6X89_01700 [Bacteroidales bacterium]|nr:hypothetical protein [Bacteroidales bacterium]